MNRLDMIRALKKALAKICNRRSWTQGRFFVIRHGRKIKWCAVGALLDATERNDSLYEACAALLNRHSPTVRGKASPLADVNDFGIPAAAHRRVLRIYRAAIKELERAK